MDAPSDTEQLPLSIHVSSLSGIRYALNRFVREFKYSPLVQVATNVMFYVSGAVVLLVYWQLRNHATQINAGLGVLFVPGSKSLFPTFLSAAVYELSILPYLWGGMLAIWMFTLATALILSAGGRNGLTKYLYAVCLLLLLLMAKVILSPLILFGD